MFTISKEITFEASHIIPNHRDPITGEEGKCARLHGHSYKIVLAVSHHKTDEKGFVIDYAYLGIILKELHAIMDHRHLNGLDQFQGIVPTAENIAYFVAAYSQTRFHEMFPPFQVPSVKYAECYETATSMARYERG